MLVRRRRFRVASLRCGSNTPETREPKYCRQRRARLMLRLPCTTAPTTPRYIHIIPHHQQSAELSLRVKCRINGLKQSRVAEWLEQALYCTLFEYLRANSLFSSTGYEDNRNLSQAKL